MRKLMALCAVALLSGCAALGPINQTFTSTKNPIVQAGITLAVATAIGNGPDQQANAAAIKAIALKVYADSSAPSATISLLEAAINTEIVKTAPNPGARGAFMILSATLEQYLNGYIQTNPSGAIASSTLVNIQGLANAVVQATSFYGV